MKILFQALVFGAILTPVAGLAADPPPFPEFTFKMSKPPKAGARKRITVQIEPEAATPLAETATKEPSTKTVPQNFAWFWEDVPAGIADDSAGRLIAAWDRLKSPPDGAGVPVPRLQVLQDIVRAHGSDILRQTVGTRVSPALVLAVIAVESGGKPAVVSTAGAEGLMQLMPDTAKRFGVADSMTADDNIKGGVAYLSWLMKEFKGDAVLALAGYNAGENAVKEHNGVPPFAETRDYVPKVLAAFNVAKGLCKTQPELITDACALNLAMN